MKIYLGNLPEQFTDAELNQLALPYGKPDSAHVARQLRGGASKGFGFVEYRTAEAAQAAIAALNGRAVRGQTLDVRNASALQVRPWSAAAHRG